MSKALYAGLGVVLPPHICRTLQKKKRQIVVQMEDRADMCLHLYIYILESALESSNTGAGDISDYH